MSRWETYRQIATWLRHLAAGEAPSSPIDPPAWENVVAAASDQLVTPALSFALQDATWVADDVADYFAGILELNRIRNREMRGHLETALRAMNGFGVEAGLLKGAAFLVDDSYPDPGIRVTADLDLLVAESQTQAASQALLQAGYEPQVGTGTPPSHHHLPALRHVESGLSVELHRNPVEWELSGLLDAHGWRAASSPIEVAEARARMANPTDRVVHCIAHGQISDRHYRRGYPQLRTLVDLSVLCGRYRAEIDWADVERRFQVAGFGNLLAGTIAQLEFLLGPHVPAGLRRGGGEETARMRRAITRGRTARKWHAAWWMVHDAAFAFRSNPSRLVTSVRKGRWRRLPRYDANW